MSLSAKSLFYFGIWMTILGGALIAVPNQLLGIFGGRPTQEGWVRIVGTLTVLIAYFCIQSAREECAGFFRWSVPVRYWIVVSFSYLVIMRYADPAILIVAAIDFVCATGTLMALRLDAARGVRGQAGGSPWPAPRLLPAAEGLSRPSISAS